MNINLSQSETTTQEIETTEVSEKEAPKPSVTLSQEDVTLLQNTLGTGLAGYARQGDIVELHKRIGEKFEKLPSEISNLDSAQKQNLVERIEAIESSLNGLEAAMRIELPPLLTQTISQAVHDTTQKRSSVLARGFWVLVLILVSAAVGAWFHKPLLELSAQVPTYLSF